MRILVIAISIFFFLPLYSQKWSSSSLSVNLTLPEIAIIDLAPNTSTIDMSVRPPTSPGQPIDMSQATNTDKWINYSVSEGRGTPKRNITAQIISGEVPKGFNLKLSAGKYQGYGEGKKGKSTGEITLSGTPQRIVKNIGGGFTGRGTNNGHQLSFSLMYEEYEDVKVGSSSITVAFTLTDN